MWFDLMTKTRQLIENLCNPFLERLNVQKTQIAHLVKSETDVISRLDQLENIVIHKNDKDSAFDLINQRITESVIILIRISSIGNLKED